MKGLLIGFFQLLCLLQVFGASQLNTNPSHQANYSYHKPDSEHVHVTKHYNSIPSISSDSSIPVEDPELIFENIEEETEDFSSDKHFSNNLFFTGIPLDQSLDYLYGNAKNSSILTEHMSFICNNKKHVVFQVFRI